MIPDEEIDPQTLALVRRIREATSTEGLARVQRALGIALWNCAGGHPTIQMAVDFRVEEIRLREGGTRLHVDMEVFTPPTFPSDPRLVKRNG
jgi:hypothetical protein